MAERYIRQSDFTNAVYMPDCPVALEKGAVLLDTKTNTYHLQLKLTNIGAMGITSVRVYAEAYDNTGNVSYPGIFIDYNEFTAVGSTFGTKKLAPLPNNNGVKFCIYVEQIKTADGNIYTCSRDSHIKEQDARDFDAERETAIKAEFAELEILMEQDKIRKSMWGATWYHAVFAICTLLITKELFSVLKPMFSSRGIGILILLSIGFLWVYAWISYGNPNILRRTVMIALFTPLLCILLWFLWIVPIWRYYGFITPFPALFGFLLRSFIISIIPFLCVFLNARRNDKSLSFTRSLLFWLKPEQADRIEQKARHYATQVSTSIKESIPNRKCPHCNTKADQDAKFCVKCGAKIDGQ